MFHTLLITVHRVFTFTRCQSVEDCVTCTRRTIRSLLVVSPQGSCLKQFISINHKTLITGGAELHIITRKLTCVFSIVVLKQGEYGWTRVKLLRILLMYFRGKYLSIRILDNPWKRQQLKANLKNSCFFNHLSFLTSFHSRTEILNLGRR